MEYGIFDTCRLNSKFNSISSIEETISLCQTAEELGFNSYWVSDHQSIGFNSYTPEILLTILGMTTNEIQLGVGGIQFNLNSPLKIAQQFKLLNSLFDNRINLGIAKAPVSKEWASELLNGGKQEMLLKNHNKRFEKLISYLRKEYNYTNDKIIVEPSKGKPPRIFVLGNSDKSMALALKNRTDICFSFFHKGMPRPNNDSLEVFINSFIRENHISPRLGGVFAYILKDDPKLHAGIDLENLAIEQIIINKIDDLKEIVEDLCNQFKLDFILFFDLSDDYQLKRKNIKKLSKLFLRVDKKSA